jgi:uncharacterized membrane protein YgcG
MLSTFSPIYPQDIAFGVYRWYHLTCMKRLLLILAACLALAFGTLPLAAKSSYSHSTRSSSSHSRSSSRKSSVPGSKDGKYVGGKGSSHKGGHYTNAKTGNHERNRRAGVPK